MSDASPPSMEALAPLVDEVRAIARRELPDPQTVEVRIWDDGTYDVYVQRRFSHDEFEPVFDDLVVGGLAVDRFESLLHAGRLGTTVYGFEEAVVFHFVVGYGAVVSIDRDLAYDVDSVITEIRAGSSTANWVAVALSGWRPTEPPVPRPVRNAFVRTSPR